MSTALVKSAATPPTLAFALTDAFYALDGGMTVVQLNNRAAVEGGPGIWPAMAVYARNKGLLPC